MYGNVSSGQADLESKLKAAPEEGLLTSLLVSNPSSGAALSLLSKSADLTKRYQYMSEWAMYPRNQVMVTLFGLLPWTGEMAKLLEQKNPWQVFNRVSPNLRLQDLLVSLKMGTTPCVR